MTIVSCLGYWSNLLLILFNFSPCFNQTELFITPVWLCYSPASVTYTILKYRMTWPLSPPPIPLLPFLCPMYSSHTSYVLASQVFHASSLLRLVACFPLCLNVAPCISMFVISSQLSVPTSRKSLHLTVLEELYLSFVAYSTVYTYIFRYV
jgi:hypothetical protein